MTYDFQNLTIGEFLKCKTIADLEDDPLQRKIKLLAAVSKRTEDEIESLSIEQLTKELKDFDSIETLSQNAKVNMHYKIKGRRFLVIWETQKLTAAQYIDATYFCKDQANIVHNIHNILAAISVEKTWYGKLKKYDGTKHKEIADLILNNMKIKKAYPILLFFCKYWEELQKAILTYLEAEVKNQVKSSQEILNKHFQKDMGG